MAVAQTYPSGDELDTWLTRNEASDLLGVSIDSLLRWERNGQLHPQKRAATRVRPGPKHEIVYDPRELVQLPRRERAQQPRTPGELAARAFELFDEGCTLREVVIRLREPLDQVEALHEQWLAAGGSQIVITEAARVALEPDLGPIATVAELCERVAILGRYLRTAESNLRTLRAKHCAEIEAAVPEGASDDDVEHAIVAALDAADRSSHAHLR